MIYVDALKIRGIASLDPLRDQSTEMGRSSGRYEPISIPRKDTATVDATNDKSIASRE